MSDPRHGKKLNRKSEDGIRWFIQHARETVGKTDDPGLLWRGHFDLATHLYQQDAPIDEVREHFVLAATHGVRAWAERKPPDETTSARIPWQFGVMLGVVAAFGTEQERRSAGEIERWKWFAPEEPFFVLQADSLSQLQSFLRDEFELDAATQVIERCNAENADRDARRFDGPLVDALVAIRRRESARLDAALKTMVKEHQHRAMHGELQKQSDGLVAVLPLGLVRLARDTGITCAIESPYLPVNLL